MKPFRNGRLFLFQKLRKLKKLNFFWRCYEKKICKLLPCLNGLKKIKDMIPSIDNYTDKYQNSFILGLFYILVIGVGYLLFQLYEYLFN